MMIVYKTKASLLIKLLFSIALVLVLLFAIVEKNFALLSIAIAFTLIVLYIFSTTHYTIFEDQLTIKSGFLFNEIIPIDKIKKITRKRKNLLSGPGFSADRLIIEFNEHDCVIISPNLQQQFIDHLRRINPDIEMI